MSSLPIMRTYPDPGACFVRGEGVRLWDADGKEYIDFLSGLGVTSLGHAHPEVAEAISRQAKTLLHVSNLFANDVIGEVAERLDSLVGGGGRLFFANSGAEANECAIKLARKWAGRGRHVVVSAFGSFHGRTLATLHATGQPAKHEPFQPLPEGFRHVPFGELETLEKALVSEVGAVLLEAVQGEGGVNPAPPGYLAGVRKLCDERGALLMVDEVQSGLGRTGEWFAFQHDGIRPDVVTIAKALGNGVPIGACWARAEVADAFQPGDHATTFGGQPLAAAAARSVLTVMMRDDVAGQAQRAGKRLSDSLRVVPGITAVRGRGLLLAAELSEGIESARVVPAAMAAGVVVNGVTPTAVRLAPPLVIDDDEMDEGVSRLARAIEVCSP